LGVLTETTGKQRDRTFAYAARTGGTVRLSFQSLQSRRNRLQRKELLQRTRRKPSLNRPHEAAAAPRGVFSVQRTWPDAVSAKRSLATGGAVHAG
jgi:hypothetical protein